MRWIALLLILSSVVLAQAWFDSKGWRFQPPPGFKLVRQTPERGGEDCVFEDARGVRVWLYARENRPPISDLAGKLQKIAKGSEHYPGVKFMPMKIVSAVPAESIYAAGSSGATLYVCTQDANYILMCGLHAHTEKAPAEMARLAPLFRAACQSFQVKR